MASPSSSTSKQVVQLVPSGHVAPPTSSILIPAEKRQHPVQDGSSVSDGDGEGIPAEQLMLDGTREALVAARLLWDGKGIMTDGTPEAMAAARKLLRQLEGDGSGRVKQVASKDADYDEREGESL
mgnify:CR=1 FL=1